MLAPNPIISESKTMTFFPDFDSVKAALNPVYPAPTITISALNGGSSVFSNCGWPSHQNGVNLVI